MANSNILNPIAYAEAKIAGKNISSITPLDVVKNLNQFAQETLDAILKLRQTDSDSEFNTLLDDMAAMAYLGKYYAKKIEAATELAFYKKTKLTEHKTKAVFYLEEAIVFWEMYAEISESNYHPQMLARTNMLDWKAILQFVKDDVEVAKNMKP